MDFGPEESNSSFLQLTVQTLFIYSLFTVIGAKEKQKILTFKKLAPANV